MGEKEGGAAGLQQGCAVLPSGTAPLWQQPGTTTSACSFSQRQLSRASWLVLLCCSWHTSGVELRVWVCITATWDAGLAELGSSRLNVSQG